MRNVIIIGGMAAGCKAAARLNRLCPDYQVTIIEKSGFISFSSCGLPLFASGDLNDLSDLTKTSYGLLRDTKFFQDVKGVNVLIETEVPRIDTEKKTVYCKKLKTGEEFELNYDYLILSTGSKAVNPKFPFPSSPLVSSFHSPEDSKFFRQAAQKGKIKKAVIIGGGFIGCEMVEALTSLWGIETILVEKENSILSAILDPEISGFVESCIRHDNIQLMVGTSVSKIEIDEKGFPLLSLDNGQKISSDFVFYNLGVMPNAKLAKESNIKVGSFGGIVVDDQMRTSEPNIWAAGDCVEIKNLVTSKPDYFSFGSLSNRMGRTAADSIASNSSNNGYTIFKGSVGTVSLKLFENIICASGLTEKKAVALGYQTGSVIGCWYDRPDYHPDSKNILGKLVYELSGMKLLGLQLVGEGEVTRYIDVFSELLAENKKVEDLLNLEHAYTPAHSNPISPLNYLGYMAINQEKEGLKCISPLKVDSFEGTFIDVRELSEIDSSVAISLGDKNSNKIVQIPLSILRMNLGNFDIDQPIMFVCEKGVRAYESVRIFKNHGYKNIAYLGGGNLLYSKINKFAGCEKKIA